VNSKQILDYPLAKRIAVLQKCIQVKPHVLEITEQKRAKTTQDIVEALDVAIENRFEYFPFLADLAEIDRRGHCLERRESLLRI